MEFQGFQSVLPAWMAVILAALLISLTILSYRKKENLSTTVKTGLIALRSLAFLILIFMLLNPYFRGFEQIREKSRVLLLIDNSNSMDIRKGDYRGAESVIEILDQINIKASEQAQFETYLIGLDVIKGNLDSLSYTESETNLYDAFQLIQDSEFDATSAILISDGIYTIGRDPLFTVSDIRIPVYTIAAGDSSRVSDLIITSLETPAVGFLDTRQPVEVSIRNNGFIGEQTTLGLYLGNTLIQERNIEFAQSEAVRNILFEITPEKEGLNTLELRLRELDGEWTGENNRKLVNVDVQNNKLRILDLAYEVHPDVGAIRNLLRSDQNINLHTRTWISGNRYVEDNQLPSPDSLELIIIHGLPEDPVNRRIMEEYISALPFILFQKPLSNELQGSQVYRNFTLIQGFGGSSEVGLYPAVESDEHPIMELPNVDYDELTPVLSQYRGLETVPGTKTLFNLRYQNLDTGQPAITIRESTGLRQVHVNSFGWFRMAQSSRNAERAWFKSLVNNMVSWTSDKPDNRRLKIETQNLSFNAGQSVEIKAFLNNESGEVENEGRIDVEIEGSNGRRRSYSMENEGNGVYSLEIPSGEEGLYAFTATARKGNRVIESRDGEFLISPSNTELINTIQNESLLRQTANLTGGKFYSFDEAANVLRDMNEAGLFRTEQSQREVYAFWVQHPLWFIFVIALLAAEWLTRKFYSLP